MGNLSSNLTSIRDNRAVRRAEKKALRKKATIEAKAQAKADRVAKKIHARADSKNLKNARKQAEKASRAAAKKAQKRADKLSGTIADTASTVSDKAASEAKSLASSAKTAASSARHAAVGADEGFAKRHKGAVELDIRKTRIEDKVRRKQLGQEAKLQAKADKRAAKDAKVGRAHERKLAELELKKLNTGKLNKDSAKRYVGFASIVLPVVAPLALKGISTAQGARGTGPISSNPATALENRIHAQRDALGKLTSNRGDEPDIARFAEHTSVRLNDLDTAIEAAESVPTAERRNVHRSISGELDRINRDVLARLGVKA